ncbi:MAG: alpha-L-arabinofuranosidase C-terminal domain-containing protein [Bacteroidales bacterium]|nr:alpha-L-arabinofuranosidase C-terminal domain-containing protein [Bacteroidales bacterium]
MKKTLATLLAGSVLLFSVNANAQDATVRVHENGTGETIPAAIYGQFSEHLGRCIYGGLWVGKDSKVPNVEGYRADVFNALKALKVPVMRWPGGCFADDYHWMDGIGPQEQRAYISNNNWGGTLEDNSFGTHEFLNLCEMLDIEPYISGNVGSGSVEEMAKWVEYMTSDAKSTMADLRRSNGRQEPWRVKYFGIGNEAWGCGGNMTPEYYSDLYRRYATYLRDFSGNRLYKIASGASDYDYNWTKVLMENLKGKGMAGVSLHYYTVIDWSDKGSATAFSDKEYYNILSKSIEIEDVLKKHIDIMDTADPKNTVDLLLDEWGTWYNVEPGTNPGHLYQQNTMRDALVAALNFNIFHKYTRRLKMANIAQVVNVLQAMILTNETEMVLTPTYHVFEMYNVHQDAEYLASDIITPKTKCDRAIDVPVVDITASKKDGELHLSLVNTDLKNSKKVLVTFDDPKSVSKILSARVLSSKDVRDYNDFGSADKVAPKAFSDYKLTKQGLELVLPPVSVVAVSAN